MEQNKKKTPEEIGKAILEQLTSPIVKALDDEGLTISYIAKNIKRLSEFKGKKPFKSNDEEGKGIIIYSDDLDYPEVQLHATEMASKLRDLFPSTRMSISGPDGTPLVTGLTDEEKALLQAVKERLKKE